MHHRIERSDENLRLMLARMLRMRIERVLEPAHIVQERRRGGVHAARADAGNHARAIHRLHILAKQMQRNIDILMHHIGLVAAHLTGNRMPCGRTQRHIRTKQQRLTIIGLVNALTGGVVTAKPEMTARHIVVHHRTGGAHGLRILGEDAGDHLDPIRADHAVGIETAQHITRSMVQAIITRGNQPLLLILMQQAHRSLGMILHELLDHGDGRIGGAVIDDNHLMRHHGLPSGVEQAIVDTLRFIPCRDDN